MKSVKNYRRICTLVKELDYKKLNLICGIEIHQQLDGEKLFCSSPTIIRDDTPDYTVTRTLRAVVGETGEIDVAAAAEMEKKKAFTYQGYADTIGLVELDEEPPHPVNQKAVTTAVQIASMLKSDIVDEVQVMRKTVVDGSNTSGFQRTALVGMDGVLTLEGGEQIRIESVVLEEDACKRVKETPQTVVYNLSRLGIPLIEIATGPDMKTPAQVQQAAQTLGMYLRSTGAVKRGLGTIRQDVNISILGGNRVEIKGAQDLQLLPTLVDYEIIRQLAILDLPKQFTDVKVHAPEDVSTVFEKTDCQFIEKALKRNERVFGFKIHNASGLLGLELQPKKRVGTDISDYLKIHVGLGGIIHSDEDLNKYSFDTKIIATLRSQLGLEERDAFVLVVAPLSILTRVKPFIEKRIHELFCGSVPKEVRKANQDGTTSYLRPMPGGARMYPETDVIPIQVDTSKIQLPEMIDQKIQRFTKLGLSIDLASKIAKGESADVFEQCVESFSTIKPSFIAETIESTPKLLKRKYQLDFQPDIEQYRRIFLALEKKEIAPSSMLDIFEKLAHSVSLEKAIEQFRLLDESQLKQIIAQVKKEHPDAPFGLLMGKVMAQTQGRADGKIVGELLKNIK
ncbi:MAG: Glu-tRNA(Gln) amidotransferase subunit GatE [Candidatus Woesearchaeota archaeon]